MNTLDYIREGYRQLSNSNYYIELDTDPTPTFNQLVQTPIDQMLREDFIDDRVHRSLTNKDPKTPNFYLLPKIHKNGVPGRPMLSANGCPTEKLSALVDCYLQPHVPKLASYVRDTKQFIQKIENIQNIPPNSFLVSFDVVSLYTNIPHADSLRAASKAQRGDTSQEPQFKTLYTNIPHADSLRAASKAQRGDTSQEPQFKTLYTNIPHADSLRAASKALRGDTSIEPQFKTSIHQHPTRRFTESRLQSSKRRYINRTTVQNSIHQHPTRRFTESRLQSSKRRLINRTTVQNSPHPGPQTGPRTKCFPIQRPFFPTNKRHGYGH